MNDQIICSQSSYRQGFLNNMTRFSKKVDGIGDGVEVIIHHVNEYNYELVCLVRLTAFGRHGTTILISCWSSEEIHGVVKSQSTKDSFVQLQPTEWHGTDKSLQ